MPRIFNSLRAQIAAWTALLCGLVVVVFVAANYWGVYQRLLEDAEGRLVTVSMDLVAQVEAGTSDLSSEFILTETVSLEAAELRVLYLSAPDSPPIIDVTNEWPQRENPPTKSRSLVSGKLRGNHWRFRHHGQEWLQVDAFSTTGVKLIAIVEIEEILAEVDQMTSDYLKTLPFVLLIVAGGTWWVSRKAVNPIQQLTAVACRVGRGKWSERIQTPLSDDEIGQLSHAFNEMMDFVEASHLQTTRFTADASHELRTPLTVIQGKIEQALADPDTTPATQASLAELALQVQRLKSIIESLLLLSRSDVGELWIDSGTFSLRMLFAELEEDLRDLLDGETVELQIDEPPDLELSGDSRLILSALFNLLHNAVRHSAGQVGMSAEQASSQVRIRVRNTGTPIPQDQTERIFERFYRSPDSDGFGLGLSLCRAIADAHQGSLRLESSDAKQTVFCFTLPLS